MTGRWYEKAGRRLRFHGDQRGCDGRGALDDERVAGIESSRVVDHGQPSQR